MSNENDFRPFPFPTNGPAQVGVAVESKKAPPRRGRPKKAKVVRAKKARKPRVVRAVVTTDNVPTPKARRPRKARSVKIDLAIAASIFTGLRRPEADALNVVMALNKKGQQRVIDALSKVFA